MTSRLDPFFATLFEQLNEHGLSYQTVSRQLSLMHGVCVSPQALRSWHLRRTAKIAKRTQSLMVACASKANSGLSHAQRTALPSSSPLQMQTTKSAISQIQEGEAVLAQRPQLHAQIKEEERKYSSFQMGGQSRYPVRRKADLTPTGQVFQTTSTTGQTPKDHQ